MKSVAVPRLLLVLVSVAVALFLIEFPAFINVVDYRPLIGPKPLDVFASTNVFDRELIHIHPPHSHYSGSARGGNLTGWYKIPRPDMSFYQWDLKYDHNGFRNEHDLESAAIVVVGDSFVENVLTPTAELITSVLAQLQGKVVANLGQYGYGPLEELIVLKRYGLPLRPQVVIWMFFEGNDLGDVIQYRKVMMTMAKPRHKPRPGFWSASWQRSFTHNTILQLRAQYKNSLRPSGATCSGIIQELNGEKRRVYFLHNPKPPLEMELAALDETARTVATAQKLSAAQGARFVFVFVPTRFRVLHTLCQFPEQSECSDFIDSDLPERVRQAVKLASPASGYLDLTPFLTDAANEGVLPYYTDDAHWSPAGQKIAAEAVNNYLVATQSR